MNTNLLKTTTLLIIIMLVSSPLITLAGPPPLDGDPGVPIDGGASLLVGAAVVYGWRKLKAGKRVPNDK